MLRSGLSSRALLAAATLAAVAACAPGPAPDAPTPPGDGTASSVADEARLERLESLYRARADSARRAFHPADVRFMTGMVAHHAQAVLMSSWAPEQAGSDAIRTLAARITNAQRDEIHLMRRWLLDRDLPAPDVAEDGRVSGHGGHMHMVGMLTDEQLARLEASRGPTFDSLYLKYMVPHHEGAVVMVRELFDTDGAAQGDFVFKLASDVQVDQSSEIARMRRMLDAMRATEPR